MREMKKLIELEERLGLTSTGAAIMTVEERLVVVCAKQQEQIDQLLNAHPKVKNG